MLSQNNCLILDKSSLEDHYPWRVLHEALTSHFHMEISEEIPAGGRVPELHKWFGRKKQGKNDWKPRLAEKVVEIMEPQEAESEMSEIVGFLRKIYHEIRNE